MILVFPYSSYREKKIKRESPSIDDIAQLLQCFEEEDFEKEEKIDWLQNIQNIYKSKVRK